MSKYDTHPRNAPFAENDANKCPRSSRYGFSVNGPSFYPVVNGAKDTKVHQRGKVVQPTGGVVVLETQVHFWAIGDGEGFWQGKINGKKKRV